MTPEEKELFESYKLETEKCWEIANRLDEANPTLKRAFMGDPSDRISRQLAAKQGDKELIKKYCTEFFYWWYNQPSSNTEQGFDDWWELKEEKVMGLSYEDDYYTIAQYSKLEQERDQLKMRVAELEAFIGDSTGHIERHNARVGAEALRKFARNTLPHPESSYWCRQANEAADRLEAEAEGNKQ